MADKPLWRETPVRDVLVLALFVMCAVEGVADHDTFGTVAFCLLLGLYVGCIVGMASAEYRIKRGR